jgi:hypothetical protein
MVLESRIATRGEDEVDQGCLATAMHAVHAIRPVCAALLAFGPSSTCQSFAGRRTLG